MGGKVILGDFADFRLLLSGKLSGLAQCRCGQSDENGQNEEGVLYEKLNLCIFNDSFIMIPKLV